MRTKSNWKITNYLLAFILILVMAASAFIFAPPRDSAFAAFDTGVDNSASFATDTIYQIVTDRFMDGNPANNPTTNIYDNNSWGSASRNNRLYHGGDWAGITQKINDGYLTGMGISAIWISSPVENMNLRDPADSSVSWTSTSYHGYWGKDFFKTNPFFGTLNEFQAMITAAHNKNIKVVIDFAPNHTSTTDTFGASWSSVKYPDDGALYRNGTLLGKMHDANEGTRNYFNHEAWINDWDSLEDVTYGSMVGLADLNQMNDTIDIYMKDSINQWLNMGVDGIRVDAVKHMSLGWQKNWVSSIYQTKPVFIFGEWFAGGTTPDASMAQFANESGMSLLDFCFANATRNAIGNLTGTMYDIHNSVVGTASSFKQVNNQVTFLDNHDMARFTTLTGGYTPSVDTAYVLQMTQRGVPAIYYGSEQYMTGAEDPDNRADMVSFNTNSNAYKIISKLAPLRKTNPALAYGTYEQRWINNDVYIYERQFGNSVVLTAVNRNSSQGYNITNLNTNLPGGTYVDALTGLKGGAALTVNAGGSVPQYYLNPGTCAVWQYTAGESATPIIGSIDPLMGVVNNNITITGRGFGAVAGSVKFGTIAGNIVNWSDNRITVKIPNIAAGAYNITVTRSNNVTSSAYPGFIILTGAQTAVRFKVNNATTQLGQNVYLVGNVNELGAWDTAKAIGPMFNATDSIGKYPTWFYDISVPKNTNIEFKFIKKDSSGNVIWESGSNHVYTTTATTGEVTVNWQ